MSRSPRKGFWSHTFSWDGVRKAGSCRSRPETVPITGGRLGFFVQHGITNNSLPLRRSGMCSLGRAGSSTIPQRLREPNAHRVAKPLREPWARVPP
jgi:hypothetical protein